MSLTAPWLGVLLGTLCLLAGLLHAGLGLTRRAPAIDAAAHALMGIGMAAMFVPAVDVLPRAVWVAGFVLVAAWFGAAAVRAGTLFDAAGHHVVGAAAMLFMLLGGHDHAAAPGAPVDAEHAGHHGAAAAGGGATLLLSVLALLLAAWFLADVARTLSHREPAPAATGTVAVRTSAVPVLTRAAHLTMSVAMAVMLIGMA